MLGTAEDADAPDRTRQAAGRADSLEVMPSKDPSWWGLRQSRMERCLAFPDAEGRTLYGLC